MKNLARQSQHMQQNATAAAQAFEAGAPNVDITSVMLKCRRRAWHSKP